MVGARVPITMGKCGQTSSVSVKDFLPVNRSRRPRRRGDANTRHRHLWHTWISVCQSLGHADSSLIWKSNISTRVLSGSMSIVTWPKLDWLVVVLKDILALDETRLGDVRRASVPLSPSVRVQRSH